MRIPSGSLFAKYNVSTNRIVSQARKEYSSDQSSIKLTFAQVVGSHVLVDARDEFVAMVIHDAKEVAQQQSRGVDLFP